MSITYGSSHALTLLSASGHERRYGGFARASLLFSPLRCSVLNGWDMRLLFEDHPRGCLGLQQEVRTLPPAETERQAHHLPVAPYGDVLPYVVVRPSQGILHLLVALLDPVSQGVKPHPSARSAGRNTLSSAFFEPGAGRFVARYQLLRCGSVAGSVVATTNLLCFSVPNARHSPSNAHHTSVCPSRKWRSSLTHSPGSSEPPQ